MSEHLKSPKGGDLDPTAFKEQLQHQPGMIIDVRTRQEYEEGHLAETDKLIDFMAGDFEEKIRELDKNETYYLYCRTGNRSGKAMEIMQNAGFREVYNIGGYQDLVSAGLDPE
jgi:phage shock protein E